MVPVQFFQSVIAIELAIVGALLRQIHFFDKQDTPAETSRPDPRLQLLLLLLLTATLLLLLLTATLFGALDALREGGGKLAAVLLTVGLAVSLLPILLRVLRPVRRDAITQPRDPQLWVTLAGADPFRGHCGASLAHRLIAREVGEGERTQPDQHLSPSRKMINTPAPHCRSRRQMCTEEGVLSGPWWIDPR